MALVPADGRREFYAEIEIGDGWTFWDCAEFVRQEVLPLLHGGECLVTRAELRDRLTAWFSTMPRHVQVACDSETDFRFLAAILSECWPKNLDKRYFDLRPMVDTTVFDKAAQRFYTVESKPHNALADAQANRRGWLSWADTYKGELK